jgi:hypothetical protein
VASSAATVTPSRRKRRAGGGISRAYAAANRSVGRSRSISSAQPRWLDLSSPRHRRGYRAAGNRSRQVSPAGRRAHRRLSRPDRSEEEENPVSCRAVRQRHPDAGRDGRCG